MTEILRVDNRTAQQLRPIIYETGLVSGANGSAYLEFGGTKVICSIHGPRSSTRPSTFSDIGQLECEFKYAPFALPFETQAASSRSTNTNTSSSSEKQISQMLMDALAATIRLEKYPKSIISVHAVVLQGCGGELAAAITGSSLALADAGVELLEIVTACHVGCIPVNMISDNSNVNFPNISGTESTEQISYKVLVDPTTKEASQASCQLTVACMCNTSEYTHINFHGRISMHEDSLLSEMTSIGKSGCQYIRNVVAKSLREKLLVKLENNP